MATLQQVAQAARATERASEAARTARIIERMRGNRAAVALGNDIPRPNPAAAGVPDVRQAARGYDDVSPARPAAPADVADARRAVSTDAVAALVQKISRDGADSLTPDEAILYEDIIADRVRVADVSATADAGRPASATAKTVTEVPAASADGDLPPATGDLTDTVTPPMDNLEASAIDLGGPTQKANPNLRVGRSAKESPASKLANEVRQLTTESAEAISPSQVRRTLNRVNNAGRAGVLEALGPDGEERLARLDDMASNSRRDANAAAAETIVKSSDERAAANAPRSPRQSAAAGLRPNAFGADPGLPALIEQFNALPDSVRADVARRLKSNPNAAAILDVGGGVDSISPNRLAEIMRPANDVDRLLLEADVARASGDNATADEVLKIVREAPREDRAAALALFTRRKALEAAMREALPSADPAPQAMASPGQPAPIRPGARTPEFATDESVAMPTRLDDAAAAARERALARASTAAGRESSTSVADRIDAVPGAESVRDVPLGMKGDPDRPTPLESRSRGERGVESNDVRAIQRELRREELLAQYREFSAAAADARAAGDVAALDAAQAEMARISAEAKTLGQRPAGGRKEMSDSRLNKPGQQETYDELGVAAAGFRPRPEANLNRSSDGLSAAERAALQDEAVRAFGETDASALLPDAGELDDVSVLGEGGRRGRLGGGLNNSRWMGAIDELYRGVNPLDLAIYDGDPVKVAEDYLSRNTTFKPGTADYDMAKEQLAKEIATRYGGGRRPGTDAPAPESSEPRGTVLTSQDVSRIPALDGATNATGTPPAPRQAKDFSQPVNPQSIDDSNLAASAVDLGEDLPAAGAAESLPAAGGGKKGGGRKGKAKPAAAAESDNGDLPPAGSGRRLTADEIKEQGDAAYQEAYWQAQESGSTPSQAAAAGKKARQKAVKELEASNEDLPPAGAGATPIAASADSAAQKPQTAAGGGGGKQPPRDPPVDQTGGFDFTGDLDATNSQSSGLDYFGDMSGAGTAAKNADDLEAAGDVPAKPAEADAPAKPGDGGGADGQKKVAEGSAQKPNRIRDLLKNKRVLAAGAGLVGLGIGGRVWDWLDDSENAPVDIPVGVGGGGPGGTDVQLPVSSGGAPPKSLSEESMAETLERIRNARNAGVGSRGTQTIGNF